MLCLQNLSNYDCMVIPVEHNFVNIVQSKIGTF